MVSLILRFLIGSLAFSCWIFSDKIFLKNQRKISFFSSIVFYFVLLMPFKTNITIGALIVGVGFSLAELLDQKNTDSK